MRIARDHGKFLHEVDRLPMDEVVRYAGYYRYEFEAQEKARIKAEQEAKKKK